MAKQMKGNLPRGVRVNETMYAILLEIARRAPSPQCGVAVTVRNLSEAIEKSGGTVRLSLHMLSVQGLINVYTQHLSNGGQLENIYSITPEGEKVLDILAETPQKG